MIDAGELEEVQLRAARIVTGLPFFFFIKEGLYLETGWGTLQTRPYIAKTKTAFKFSMRTLFDYLFDLFMTNGKIYHNTTQETRISLMFLSAG